MSSHVLCPNFTSPALPFSSPGHRRSKHYETSKKPLEQYQKCNIDNGEERQRRMMTRQPENTMVEGG